MRNKYKFAAAALALISASGCASFEKKWGKIDSGQTRAEAIDIMGPPVIFEKREGGEELVGWSYNSYTRCGVILDSDKKVKEKGCEVDEAGRNRAIAADQARAAYWLQMQAIDAQRQSQSDSQPNPMVEHLNQKRQNRPYQTECQNNGYGRTNCTTQQRGY